MTTITPRFSTDQLWEAVDAQRQQTADLLDSLRPDEWARPSLCSEWTVKDVAGHLVWHGDATTLSSLRSTMMAMARARGDINRATSDLAQQWAAARTPEQLVSGVRALVGLHRPPVGTTPANLLIDSLVHHHDISLALGRGLAGDVDAAAHAGDLVLTLPARFELPVTRALRSLRWRATDVDWDHGDGELVEGPMLGVLVALMGRPAALEHLEGPGVGEARRIMEEVLSGRSG